MELTAYPLLGKVIPFFVGFGSLVTVTAGQGDVDDDVDEDGHESAQVAVLLFITAFVLGPVRAIAVSE